QVNHYNQQCANCHQPKECKAPVSQRTAVEDNCVRCHMPQGAVSDIPHVSFTDHWIRKPIPQKSNPSSVQAQKAAIELICMTSNADPPTIGLAYLQYFERKGVNRELVEKALPLLDTKQHYARSTALWYLGRIQEAYQEAKLATQAEETNAWAWYRLGEIEEALNRKSDALQHFLKAKEMQPALIETYLKVGNLQIQLANRNRDKLLLAEQTFLQGQKQFPCDERMYCNVGYVRLLLSNYPEAEKSLLEAVRLSPDYLLAWENLLLVYFRQNQIPAAKKCLSEIIRIQPDYPKKQDLQRLLGKD
ncbi:MAG: hypothetical protein NZ108_10600, partial [Bacteroidia bacterium]|nr:hypothetical protein [Bacteroidia bacterium]